jgi:hypothetical protein
LRAAAAFGCLSALVANAALAQDDHAYCYMGDPPPGITATGESDGPGPFEVIYYIYYPTMFRQVCGTADRSEMDVLKTIYSEAGCAKESDVGQVFEQAISVDVSKIESYPFIAYLRSQEPVVYNEVCSLYGSLAPLNANGRPWRAAGPELHKTLDDAGSLWLPAHIRFREREQSR